MITINHTLNGAVPFQGLKKIADLLFYEQPILSHYRDVFNNDLLLYWIDYSEHYDRWLLIQVTRDSIYQYLIGDITLASIISKPNNNVYYILDSTDDIDFNSAKIIFKGELPENYFPSQNSFYGMPFPDVYDTEIQKYGAWTRLGAMMRDDALFIKVESLDKRTGDSVPVKLAASFLTSVGESFTGMVEYRLGRDYPQLYSNNSKQKARLKNIKEALEPQVVELKRASFGVAITINHAAPPDTLSPEWVKSIVDEFKTEVIDVDYNNPDTIRHILTKYPSSEDRNKIYSPILDI
jgi:hypothetical protein